MANFTYQLSNVEVRYYVPTQPLEIIYITGATATYIISTFGMSIGYYLNDVTGGTRHNPLTPGTPVIVTGKTSDGQTITTHGLFCIDPQDPASFKYPLFEAPTSGA